MSSDPEDIGEFIDKLKKEREGIKKQIVDICFFMKGGVTYEEAWLMSFRDRERIIDRVNKWNKEMHGGKDYL